MKSPSQVTTQPDAGFRAGVTLAVSKLAAYCRKAAWAGHDPYDALNSPLFRKAPFLNRRIPRLVFTQALKRSPINLRRLLYIPSTQNAKAIALFLSAFLGLQRINNSGHDHEIEDMVRRLRELRSPGSKYWCWGYNFPWQTRTIIVPCGAPNLVCTTFVANALFDAFEQSNDARCFEMALSAVQYIFNVLYWSDGSAAGFSYPAPQLRSEVHNANLMAAALLCRAYKHTGDEELLRPAMHVTRYSLSKQHSDGSWLYGELPSQNWVDNFHTGYNLCALQSIARDIETTEFDQAIGQGMTFYRNHFFRESGAVAYFHDRTYPIDVHCVAQSVITMAVFKNSDNLRLAESVLRWALEHLWDEKGFFYYRKLKSYTDRTSYMRWSQAWMLLAMVTFLEATGNIQAQRETDTEVFVSGSRQ